MCHYIHIRDETGGIHHLHAKMLNLVYVVVMYTMFNSHFLYINQNFPTERNTPYSPLEKRASDRPNIPLTLRLALSCNLPSPWIIVNSANHPSITSREFTSTS